MHTYTHTNILSNTHSSTHTAKPLGIWTVGHDSIDRLACFLQSSKVHVNGVLLHSIGSIINAAK